MKTVWRLLGSADPSACCACHIETCVLPSGRNRQRSPNRWDPVCVIEQPCTVLDPLAEKCIHAFLWECQIPSAQQTRPHEAFGSSTPITCSRGADDDLCATVRHEPQPLCNRVQAHHQKLVQLCVRNVITCSSCSLTSWGAARPRSSCPLHLFSRRLSLAVRVHAARWRPSPERCCLTACCIQSIVDQRPLFLRTSVSNFAPSTSAVCRLPSHHSCTRS